MGKDQAALITTKLSLRFVALNLDQTLTRYKEDAVQLCNQLSILEFDSPLREECPDLYLPECTTVVPVAVFQCSNRLVKYRHFWQSENNSEQ